MSVNGQRILVALDFPTLEKAKAVATPLRGKVGFKVGMELNTAAGTPAVIEAIGTDVFLDLKFHDIPNTVAGAVKAASQHYVKMINVHCLGGRKMLEAAADAAEEVFVKSDGTYKPLIIGVTILTSHDRASLKEIGIDPKLPMEEIVKLLGLLAAESGLDGVVCSPMETGIIRRQKGCDKGFVIINPGIRSKTALVSADDQKRTMTAGEAIKLGADYLVIGRPITVAADPVAAAEQFVQEIDEALAPQA